MKKILSVSYSDWAFNLSMFLLRLVTGALIIPHGYDKLVHFAEKKNTFMNLAGLGSATSLSLDIFAEFFCGMFILLGLFTRLAAVPLVVAMCVVVFKATHADFFGKSELGALYLAAFLAILFCGPGNLSADKIINK